MKSFLLIIFAVSILFATITQADKKRDFSGLTRTSFNEAPGCAGRPEFITEVRPEIIGGISELPKLVLVAKEANYYVESKNQGQVVKVHAHQSFASTAPKETSRIICGSSKNAESFRSSLFAPTLIDTTETKKIGQSLWQFQMVVDKESVSVWNKRSLAFSENDNLEKELMKFGGNFRIYQLSENQYEVVVSKDSIGVVQYLSIKYDAVKSL